MSTSVDERLRVAVVGAGVSGIVTARSLSAAGFAVTVFEKSEDVGGVWSGTRRYPGVATQDDRRSYAFSDQPLDGSAEHASGSEVQAYLQDYLAGHGLDGILRLATEVVRARPIDGPAWEIDSVGPDGHSTERFDWLVVANGVFSTPHVPDWPGRRAFEAAGGRVIVPSSLGDGTALDGRRTVVVGWGKTACDVAVVASRRSRSTAVIARTLTWKYPKRIGLGALTFRHLVLTRAGERILGTRYRSATTGRVLLRRIPERLPRLAIGALVARSIDRSIGLQSIGLRPTSEVRTSNSLVTDGFFEAVRDGRIEVLRERSVAALAADSDGPLVELSDGSQLRADVLVAATGFRHRVDFLDLPDRDDGDMRNDVLLHRRILAVDVPQLAVIGWAHSYRSPLTSEVAAAWLVAAMLGRVALPTEQAQRAGAHRLRLRGTATSPGSGTAELPSVTMRDLDRLLEEAGSPLPWRVRLRQVWRPTDPSDYAVSLHRIRGDDRASDGGGGPRTATAVAGADSRRSTAA